jgi:ADP-heptose:LPS heptosyltransferase
MHGQGSGSTRLGKPIDAEEIRRILVIKWSAMGDVVGATTFIDDIRAAYPTAEIHLNTLPPWDRLFEGDPRLAKVFTVDVRGRKGRLKAGLKWVKTVWAGRYDLIFDLQSTDRSRIMLGLLRLLSPQLKAIVGHNPGYPYTHAPQRPAEPYPGWHSDLALRVAGVPRIARHGHLHVSKASRENVAALMMQHGLVAGKYVLLLPGSQKAGWLKRWGVQRYAALARALREAGVERIAIIGGPDEVEDCAAIAEQGGVGVINLNGKTSISEIVPLAEGAACIVGNDTGAAHVASCAGKPMLVICGATDPRRVRPIGPHVQAVQWSGPCINCYRKTCNYRPELACMEAVSVETVAEWVLVQSGIRQGAWVASTDLRVF